MHDTQDLSLFKYFPSLQLEQEEEEPEHVIQFESQLKHSLLDK